jgi:hypothetical protein
VELFTSASLCLALGSSVLNIELLFRCGIILRQEYIFVTQLDIRSSGEIFLQTSLWVNPVNIRLQCVTFFLDVIWSYIKFTKSKSEQLFLYHWSFPCLWMTCSVLSSRFCLLGKNVWM